MSDMPLVDTGCDPKSLLKKWNTMMLGETSSRFTQNSLVLGFTIPIMS